MSSHLNFNSQHRCREFDAALKWAIANQAQPSKEGKIYRPTDETYNYEYNVDRLAPDRTVDLDIRIH
jgi:hypothetical protein